MKKNIILTDGFDWGKIGNYANYIIEINDSFDLNNQGITLPENIELNFNGGGSLSNINIIDFNDCIIKATPYQIFFNVETFEGKTISSAYPEWFGAKGDDSTKDHNAVQCALDSAYNVILTQTYRLGEGLVTTRSNHINGGGTLNADCSFANKKVLSIKHDNSLINNIVVGNPDSAVSREVNSVKHAGISIAANNCIVSNCRVSNFIFCIEVSHKGEFYDIIISNNIISDVLGGGLGPLNTDNGDGEDRGDGITFWGASGIIDGNIVIAKNDEDCRIGIHCEALIFKDRPDNSKWSEQSVIISNNIVRGSFRRGIVNEGINKCVIQGNIITSGITWWAIAVATNSPNTIISNNSIEYDRDTSDKSGSAWNVVHAAIMVIGAGTGESSPKQVIIDGNTIEVTNGGGHGIRTKDEGKMAENIIIQNNLIKGENVGDFDAINVANSKSYTIKNNTLTGFSNGINSSYNVGCGSIYNNEILTPSNWAIRCENNFDNVNNAYAPVDIKNNIIKDSVNGIIVSNTKGSLIDSNSLSKISNTVLSFFGSGENSVIVNNTLYNSVRGKIEYVDPDYTLWENNHGFFKSSAISPNQIENINSPLNQKWKYQGKMVYINTNELYIANGTYPNDSWKKIEDGSTVTPE